MKSLPWISKLLNSPNHQQHADLHTETPCVSIGHMCFLNSEHLILSVLFWASVFWDTSWHKLTPRMRSHVKTREINVHSVNRWTLRLKPLGLLSKMWHLILQAHLDIKMSLLSTICTNSPLWNVLRDNRINTFHERISQGKHPTTMCGIHQLACLSWIGVCVRNYPKPHTSNQTSHPALATSFHWRGQT